MSKFTKVILLLLAVVIVFYIVFIVLSKATNDYQQIDRDSVGRNSLELVEKGVQEVVISKKYENGKYFLNGKLVVPTPCHTIEQDVVIRESFPEQVQIYFSFVDSGDVCAQVLTAKSFEVSFQANEQAIIQGFLNDKPIKFIQAQS